MLLATFAAFIIAMIMMAIGLLIGRPAIRRGCGEDCECIRRRIDDFEGPES